MRGRCVNVCVNACVACVCCVGESDPNLLYSAVLLGQRTTPVFSVDTPQKSSFGIRMHCHHFGTPVLDWLEVYGVALFYSVLQRPERERESSCVCVYMSVHVCGRV